MDRVRFEDEIALLDNVERAYERARREVYDRVGHDRQSGISEHQQQLLDDLEAAHAELRFFRHRRRL